MSDRHLLLDYLLHLADNQMILSHRLSELCGHAPELEQDIALTNIALDLIGQTRLLLQYAEKNDPQGRNEDQLAFLRDAHQFRNVLLAEQPNRDFAHVIVRQYFFDEFNHLLYSALTNSKDSTLAEIAQKAIIEIRYHLRFSRNWMLRLGDGTDVSNAKMQEALEWLWPFTGEFFRPSRTETTMTKAGIGPDVAALESTWLNNVNETLKEARLNVPAIDRYQDGGKNGVHTEHLGYILADMQFLQRAYPGLEW